MKSSSKLLMVCALAVALAGCSGGTASGTSSPGSDLTAGRSIVLRNGTLIDGSGDPPITDAAVIIEDAVITSVGPASEIGTPDGATVIDAGGGTILPGLIDTHTHHLNELRLSGGGFDGLSADLYLTAPLRAGVTTYRDLGSDFGQTRSVDELRVALDESGAGAPAVIIAGPIIAAEENWAVENFPTQVVAVADPSTAAAAATRLLERGVDQVKVMVEEAEFTGSPTPSLTSDQIAAITRAVHGRDRRVVAHVSDVDEAWMAVRNGVDELTHWPGPDPLPEELLAELVALDIPVGTTFSIITPADDDVRRLLDAGGTIVLSSDAPGASSPTGIAREMGRMVRAGMTPMEAILATTRDAARVVGLGDQIGTLRAGRQADIVIVEGDPLTDIAAMENVSFVIKQGELVVTPAGTPEN